MLLFKYRRPLRKIAKKNKADRIAKYMTGNADQL